MNEVKIIHCTTGELKQLIQESLNSSFANTKNKEQKELLTRSEICKALKISLSTLWRWTEAGKLPCHRIGNRVYYKIDEVEQCLIKSK